MLNSELKLGILDERIVPFLDTLTFSHAYTNWGFCYIRGINCFLFPLGIAESFIKRKDLLE